MVTLRFEIGTVDEWGQMRDFWDFLHPPPARLMEAIAQALFGWLP